MPFPALSNERNEIKIPDVITKLPQWSSRYDPQSRLPPAWSSPWALLPPSFPHHDGIQVRPCPSPPASWYPTVITAPGDLGKRKNRRVSRCIYKSPSEYKSSFVLFQFEYFAGNWSHHGKLLGKHHHAHESSACSVTLILLKTFSYSKRHQIHLNPLALKQTESRPHLP